MNILVDYHPSEYKADAWIFDRAWNWYCNHPEEYLLINHWGETMCSNCGEEARYEV